MENVLRVDKNSRYFVDVDGVETRIMDKKKFSTITDSMFKIISYEKTPNGRRNRKRRIIALGKLCGVVDPTKFKVMFKGENVFKIKK